MQDAQPQLLEPADAAQISGVHLLADLLRSQEILLHVRYSTAAVHPDGILQMQVKTAVVQIDGPHDGVFIVADHGLGVDEARGVFIDMNARFLQRFVVGSGQEKHGLLIGDMGRDDPHVDPGLRGGTKRCHHLIVDDEVGGSDVYIFFGPVNHVQVGRFAHQIIIQRKVRVGEDYAVRGNGFHPCSGRTIAGEGIHLSAGKTPQREILHGHAPYGTAPETHAGILPVAVFCIGVDVLIRQIDAACKADLPVDDADFAVIPVIEPGGENGVEGIEHAHPQSLCPQDAIVMAGQCQKTPQIVVHQPHFHALFDFSFQHFQDAVPHGAFFDNEVLQENERFRCLQLPQKRIKERLSNGEIFRLGMDTGR